MIKVVICVKRKKGMTPEEFHHYMRHKHGELVKNLNSTKKYIRKYVQSYTIPEEYEQGNTPYDAVSELWFDSLADLKECSQTTEVLEKVRPDEKHFADQAETVIFVTEEVQIYP